MQMFLTLLVVGLPIALLLSWAFDVTAEGIERTGDSGAEGTLVVGNTSARQLEALIRIEADEGAFPCPA